MVYNVSFISASSSSASRTNTSNSEFKSKLRNLGVPDEVISQGSAAVQTYCQENNITIPEPPQKPNNQANAENKPLRGADDGEAPAELKQKLIALGVPAATISQGREAVMQYCQENNITIPEPPQKGFSLNMEG